MNWARKFIFGVPHSCARMGSPITKFSSSSYKYLLTLSIRSFSFGSFNISGAMPPPAKRCWTVGVASVVVSFLIESSWKIEMKFKWIKCLETKYTPYRVVGSNGELSKKAKFPYLVFNETARFRLFTNHMFEFSFWMIMIFIGSFLAFSRLIFICIRRAPCVNLCLTANLGRPRAKCRLKVFNCSTDARDTRHAFSCHFGFFSYNIILGQN